MALHSPFDRHFFVNGGTTMTSGYSLQLAKGQIGLFDPSIQTKDGIAAVSTLAGSSKDKKFVIKMGASDLPVNRSQDNKAWSTHPFSMGDVVKVRVSAPKTSEQSVDEVIIGYNGIDSNTAITFTKGDRQTIYLRLSGEWVGMLGFPDNFVEIQYTMEADDCIDGDCADADCDTCDTVDCGPIILRAIEFLKNYEIRGGVKVSDAIDITPIKSCTTEPTYTEVPYDFQSLTVTDLGDDSALALVQAQYPLYKIVRKDRIGTTSIYETVTPDATSLSDYTQTIASIIKGCEDCPAGYTEVPGGVLYAISIEDDGVDLSTTVDNLPGFVSGTAVRQGFNHGVGFYTVVVDDELTAGEITTWLATNAITGTATVTKVGTVEDLCSNSTTTSTAWVVGDTCNVSSETYIITLPDNECGETRLAEIQAAYPDNTIAISQEDSLNSARTVTLTGTSGTANITVTGTGTAYLATFATSLAVTAANFVTAHAAALLADEGITVTSDGAVLTFTHTTVGYPTVTAAVNATGNLAGTLGDLEVVEQNVAGGCMTQYETTVITNLVCEECDEIYKDYFVTTAPEDYDMVKWERVSPTPEYTGCLCGIRFKGKVLENFPEEYLRDLDFGFMQSSTKIEVSGGFVTDQREGIGSIRESYMNVQYLSRWQPVTHMGGNLWEEEDRSFNYFNGTQRHGHNYVAKLLKGELSTVPANTQYVDYAIDIRRQGYSQGMSERSITTNTFHIMVELGRHTNVEALVNRIAGAAGLPGVKA